MKTIKPHSIFVLLCWLCANLPGLLQAQEGTPPPSVTVAEVVSKDVTPTFEYVGRAEAVERVELRARVEGFLQQRNFQEGSFVKQGDLLFVIEKPPYEVIADQHRADLAGAEASLKNAQADLARKRELLPRKLVSAAEVDAAEAAEATARAAVLQAKAALKSAELNLSYTDIYSPIAGQISRARYSIGNLVGPGSEALATVTSADPIYVTIAVSDKQLLEVRRQRVDAENPRVFPSLVLADGSRYPHPGRFDYLDTAVNQSTDTLTARARFANPDNLLVPGQFVTVVVQRTEPVSALVVPQAAVQQDQQGYFVLVVDQTDKVEVRRIRVGDALATEWVVEEGLAAGERVIVQGIQKVRPDMVVNPVMSEG